MATLSALQEQKRELEARLESGDLSAEAALSRVDAAIVARTRQIEHSQKRLGIVKQAVERGLSVAKAKSLKPESAASKRRNVKKNKPVNKFE